MLTMTPAVAKFTLFLGILSENRFVPSLGNAFFFLLFLLLVNWIACCRNYA